MLGAKKKMSDDCGCCLICSDTVRWGLPGGRCCCRDGRHASRVEDGVEGGGLSHGVLAPSQYLFCFT